MVSGLIISFHEGLIRGSSLPCSKMANDRDTMKDVSHTGHRTTPRRKESGNEDEDPSQKRKKKRSSANSISEYWRSH